MDGRDDKHLVIDGKKLLNFAGNDYLGLANHPDVKRAFAAAANEFGLGSTSSPLFSGYSRPHQTLEEAFATFLGRDRAILFNSGYHANLAIMTTIAGRHTKIFADKYCHASLLDGISLSRAELIRYRHQDISHVKHLITDYLNKKKLLVTESVFSMEGNITDAKSFAELANTSHATLVIDDAHGIGILGKSGKGICEHANLSQKEVPCLVTPLGKAPGSMGAIVSGSDEFIESLIQNARTYRYSTALPPAVCAATITSLHILESESWRREKLRHLICFFNQAASDRGLTLLSQDTTPIRCILIGENKKTVQLHDYLKEQSYYVACGRPPAVPTGAARLRISLNCMHDENDIIGLLDLIGNQP